MKNNNEEKSVFNENVFKEIIKNMDNVKEIKNEL